MNEKALTLAAQIIREKADANNRQSSLRREMLLANESSENVMDVIIMQLDNLGQQELYKKVRKRVATLYDRLVREPLASNVEVSSGESSDKRSIWREINFGEEYGQLDIRQNSDLEGEVCYRAIMVGGLPPSVDKGIPHEEKILLRLKTIDMPEGSDLIHENFSLLNQYQSLCELCKLIGIVPQEDYADFLKNEYSGLLSTVSPSNIDGA